MLTTTPKMHFLKISPFEEPHTTQPILPDTLYVIYQRMLNIIHRQLQLANCKRRQSCEGSEEQLQQCGVP